MKHVPEHEQLRGRDDGHLAALTPCLTKLGIIDESAKDDAIGYAKARAKFGRGEIRVLRSNCSIESLIRA